MIERYRDNQKKRLEGKVLGYPFYATSPKLGKFIPAIPKGKAIHVTASTNVGKSQFWRWYFLVAPYLLWKLNPDSNFKPRFIIFLLEETYDQLYNSLVCMFVFIKYKVIIDPSKLEGFSEQIISDKELEMVDSIIFNVEEILSLAKVVDNVYNPTGLFKIARAELLKHGSRNYTTLVPSKIIMPEEEYAILPKDQQKKYKFYNYIQNDPNEYVFVITDNVNLLEEEMREGHLMNLQDTIWRWSTDYAHKQLQKNYNCIVVDIIQQAGDQEKQQYNFSGNNIIEKMKPSRAGYGDNKRIARNADLIIGLFAPTFYGESYYEGFNMEVIGDFFRTIIILKNRLGRGFKEIPVFFNGAVNYFAELDINLPNSDIELIKKGLYQRNFKKIA